MEKRCWWKTVLPGDGIGVEGTRETTRVLRAIEERLLNPRFELTEHPAGEAESFCSVTPLPKPTFDGRDDADPAYEFRSRDGANLEILSNTRHNLGYNMIPFSMREDRFEFGVFSSTKDRELVRSDGVTPAPVVAVRDMPEPLPWLAESKLNNGWVTGSD